MRDLAARQNPVRFASDSRPAAGGFSPFGSVPTNGPEQVQQCGRRARLSSHSLRVRPPRRQGRHAHVARHTSLCRRGNRAHGSCRITIDETSAKRGREYASLIACPIATKVSRGAGSGSRARRTARPLGCDADRPRGRGLRENGRRRRRGIARRSARPPAPAFRR